VSGLASVRNKWCKLGFWVGRCLWVDGRTRDAVERLALCFGSTGKTLSVDQTSRLARLHALASAHIANGQIRNAIKFLEHVVALWGKMLAEVHPCVTYN
jgi:hypothetical protein